MGVVRLAPLFTSRSVTGHSGTVARERLMHRFVRGPQFPARVWHCLAAS